MSRHYAKVIEVESNGKNFLIGLFDRAKRYGWSSSKIQEEYQNYRESIKIKNFPVYVSSYLTGIYDVLTSQVYNNDLEFCYVVKDKKYSIRKESPMYYEKHGLTPKSVYDLSSGSGHFWIESGNTYFYSKSK